MERGSAVLIWRCGDLIVGSRAMRDDAGARELSHGDCIRLPAVVKGRQTDLLTIRCQWTEGAAQAAGPLAGRNPPPGCDVAITYTDHAARAATRIGVVNERGAYQDAAASGMP